MISNSIYQSTIQLIRILERPDYQRYKRRIHFLLVSLDQDKPDLFPSLIDETSLRNRYLTELHKQVREWQNENPLIGIEIKTEQDFLAMTDLFQQICQHGPDHNRRQSLELLSSKLKKWHQKHPWVVLPDLTIPKTFEPYLDPMMQAYLHHELKQDTESDGVKSLRFQALISNPQSVAGAEKELGLPMTGDRTIFLSNYRNTYYNADTAKNNSIKRSLELLATTTNFVVCRDILLSLLNRSGSFFGKDIAVETLIRHKRLDVIDSVIDQYKSELDQSLGYNVFDLCDLLLSVAASAALIADFQFCEKYITQATILYRRLFVERAYVDLFMGQAESLIKAALARLLEYGVKSENCDMINLTINHVLQLLADESINGILSRHAASRPTPAILQYLEQHLGRFDLRGALRGAASVDNNPDVIDYLTSHIVNVQVRPGLVYECVRSGNVKMLELLINTSNESFLDTVCPLYHLFNVSQYVKPEIIDLIMSKYIDQINNTVKNDYFKAVIYQALTDKLDVLTKYPFFRQQMLDMRVLARPHQLQGDKRYKIARYALHHGYVKPDPDFEDLYHAFSVIDVGTVEAMIDYYTEHDIVIDRRVIPRLLNEIFPNAAVPLVMKRAVGMIDMLSAEEDE